MRDLFGNTEKYWYSLVSASPMPENGERANVAVLVGNGRVSAIRYHEQLPRLAGIAATDEINVYQAVLKEISEQVRSRGMPIESIQGILSPQMEIGKRRELQRAPDDALLDRLVSRFLAAPRQPARETNMEALVRKSMTRLDAQLARARPRGVLVQNDVRPGNLYEGKLDRYVPFHVPKLARALRGIGKDVLLDSLVIEDTHEIADVRVAAGRIGQAFYAYQRKLKPLIQQFANRDIRVIGVLQPGLPTDSADTRALREYIRDTWKRDAEVIDGNEQDVETELRQASKWVSAA
jgi:hypothetical protein